MDGSGKSTVADMLKNNLEKQGRTVLDITHPNDNTRIGRIEGKLLCKEGKMFLILAIIFYILDVLHSLRIKRKSIKQYDDFIFVRYSMAAAYLPEKLCPKVYKIICKVLPVPEVKIFVDVNAEAAMKRILERGEELEMFETEEKLEHTRKKMLSIAEDWIIIDNSKTLENTARQIKQIPEVLEC